MNHQDRQQNYNCGGWSSATKNFSFGLSLHRQLCELASFDEKYPQYAQDNTDKHKQTKIYINLVERYLDAATNVKKFQIEDCQHTNVHVMVEQIRNIDEMGTLTRFCKDCGESL